MAIEIVSFPIKNGGSFHSFDVSLPGRVSDLQILGPEISTCDVSSEACSLKLSTRPAKSRIAFRTWIPGSFWNHRMPMMPT